MKGFKLLAIRPQGNCSNRFLKNLEKGTIYKFYGEYFYYNSKNEEIDNSYHNIHRISVDETSPHDLYSYKDDNLNINVSSIVGKNGSGKSTLLELLYVASYILAAKASIITGVETIESKVRQRKYKWTSVNERRQISEIQKVYNDLDVEIVYLIDDRLRILKLDCGVISVSVFRKKDDYHLYADIQRNHKNEIVSFLKYFFYTISINYSQYGLNEKSLGLWTKYLFHKNDAYQTPVVVNPFRSKGNIDVNNELHLSQTRFISNLILTDNLETVNGKILKSVDFEINRQNFVDEFGQFLSRSSLDEITFVENVYNYIYKLKVGYEKTFDRNRDVYFLGIQANYLYVKIVKIRDQYYETFSLEKNNIIDFDRMIAFLEVLANDNSHITLKLRQTLNNIRFNILNNDNGGKWDLKENKYTIDFRTLKSLIRNIKKYNDFLQYEELIPIACFTPTIFIENQEKSDDSVNKMTTLSSGEQHQIHTIQSILYHVMNLESVHDGNRKSIKYKNVNIIFDEIELYFHPEFQRTFLFELLKSLKSLPLKKITNINILFCTHSPFILSDIAKQATLSIKNGYAETYINTNDNNSFGANIHDLLKEDFYLSNGFMGEFAKDKTKSLIYHLDKQKTDEYEISQIKNEYYWDEVNSLKYIEIIGEPLLRETLRDLYFKKYNSNVMIRREIERLQNLIRMNNDIS
ncbi:AAA family ATPase [Chryseobacterium sp. SSA4.19]|uniref:AAA family ATPase n=1 Tax=Chryseobacterium sp. SSA4.19 TaxID=2919915 RepID=UPI001F4E49AF|nr:AAA family ATPase [Chryseobacterium sp. SSA4.19]MCJ8154115.1 AAA family ATPase [Chryseobacterium sp. SSA4.19]